MVIFDYLEEKDRFMQYYRRKLSIRLIQAASGSEEDEKRMVIHFKVSFLFLLFIISFLFFFHIHT